MFLSFLHPLYHIVFLYRLRHTNAGRDLPRSYMRRQRESLADDDDGRRGMAGLGGIRLSHFSPAVSRQRFRRCTGLNSCLQVQHEGKVGKVTLHSNNIPAVDDARADVNNGYQQEAMLYYRIATFFVHA